MIFTGKLLVERSALSSRSSVKENEYFCHMYVKILVCNVIYFFIFTPNFFCSFFFSAYILIAMIHVLVLSWIMYFQVQQDTVIYLLAHLFAMYAGPGNLISSIVWFSDSYAKTDYRAFV